MQSHDTTTTKFYTRKRLSLMMTSHVHCTLVKKKQRFASIDIQIVSEGQRYNCIANHLGES